MKPLHEFRSRDPRLIGAQSEVKPLREFRSHGPRFIGAQSEVKPFEAEA